MVDSHRAGVSGAGQPCSCTDEFTDTSCIASPPCGQCAWCWREGGIACPHGYACCRNCTTCNATSKEAAHAE